MANERVYKCSLLMSKGKSGWSDTMWLPTSFSQSIQDAMVKMLGYCVARAEFTDDAVTFESIRISDTDNPQAVLIKTLNTSGNVAATTIDMPSTAVLVTMTSLGGRRKMYLRGVKDSDTKPGFADQLSSGLRSKINTWGNFVKSQDFVTYNISQGNNPKINISNVEVSNGLIKITTAANHGFSEGQKVYIGKLASSPVLNGNWKISNPLARSFTLVGSNNTLESILWLPGNAYVRGQDKVSYIVTGVDINRLVTRRTGRPTGLSTGARRKKLPRLPIRLAVS